MASPAPAESSSSCITITNNEECDAKHVVLRSSGSSSGKMKYRKDYKIYDFTIDFVDLTFFLNDTDTKVISRLAVRRISDGSSNLMLDGDSLCLNKCVLEVGSKPSTTLAYDPTLSASDFSSSNECVYGVNIDEGKLIVGSSSLPTKRDETFYITTDVTLQPKYNLQLMGLYKSGNIFCTQCEAEGFRRIGFFIDRPDIMAKYKVKIIGRKDACPVLLSNGNMIDKGAYTQAMYSEDCSLIGIGRLGYDSICGGSSSCSSDLHFSVFEDPFPKPCYLFALVAGDLRSISSSFTTMSGRKVHIEIFAEKEDVGKLHWAMLSTKKAMKWDEEAFGREYDLDVFNIVCAKDFNMGAMENKGLNVFNTALLLADAKTSTDSEYQRILNVVGHEYFHNWTGNRVTCRDWFQLTLKEGLTVYRDQLFTCTVADRTVKRIQDVNTIRSHQYGEDSGPMSHPIRPESYVAMDNFYTVTVYDKGAEVIRMYSTLLGAEGFRKGMNLYFSRFDGCAVTCDDFRNAMADANAADLSQFEQWYLQSGTPLLEVSNIKYDSSTSAYSLKIKQSVPSAKSLRPPLHIPIKVGLIGKQSKKDLIPSTVLELRESEKTFEIPNVKEEPVLSMLRDYSAPVRVCFLDYSSKEEEAVLCFLMGHDTDIFNRWDSSQILASRAILKRAKHMRDKGFPCSEPLSDKHLEAFKLCLVDKTTPPSMKASLLSLPEMGSLVQEMGNPVVHECIHFALESIRTDICRSLEEELYECYEECSRIIKERENENKRTYGKDNSMDSQSEVDGYNRCLDQILVGSRRLRNVVLDFICVPPLIDEDNNKANDYVMRISNVAYKHFKVCGADSMSDKVTGFRLLCCLRSEHTDKAIVEFLEDAKDDALQVDKWFSIQAISSLPSTTATVKALLAHPLFIKTNPNRLRSVIFAYARNTNVYNDKSGEGYKVVADAVIDIDKFNPQIAARACSFLINYKILDTVRQELVVNELNRIQNTPCLSKDTLEIVHKALADKN